MAKVYRNGNYSAYYGYVDPEDDPEEEEAEVAEKYRLVWNWQTMDRTCSDCGETRSVKYDVGDKAYCNMCIGKTGARRHVGKRAPGGESKGIDPLCEELQEAIKAQE